jgi:hypothetical protein
MPLLGFHPSTSGVFGATFEDLREQKCEAQVPPTGSNTGSERRSAVSLGRKNSLNAALTH